MAKVTLESIMQFMLEHMATKEDLASVENRTVTKEDLKRFATNDDLDKELNSAVGMLERKIENTKIDLKTAMYKQELELKNHVTREIDGLARVIHDALLSKQP